MSHSRSDSAQQRRHRGVPARPVSQGPSAGAVCSFRSVVRGVQCMQQVTHCTLHTAHCTLHTAHCTLHTLPHYCSSMRLHFFLPCGRDSMPHCRRAAEPPRRRAVMLSNVIDLTACFPGIPLSMLSRSPAPPVYVRGKYRAEVHSLTLHLRWLACVGSRYAPWPKSLVARLQY